MSSQIMKEKTWAYMALLLPCHKIVKGLELRDIGSCLSRQIEVPVNDTIVIL